MKIPKSLFRWTNRLFESYIWKGSVFLFFLGLLLLLIYLGINLQQLISLFTQLGRAPYQSINQLLQDLIQLGYIAIGLVSLLMVAAFFDFRRLTQRNRNLESMIKVIRHFAAGRREERMVVEGQHELRKAAESFNSMADTLVASIKKLENLDASRRELMHYLAHDFGSPLTAIQGFAETISLRNDRQTLNAQDLSTFSQVILTNTKYLAGLVANLSDLSRLDEPDFKPTVGKFSLSTLASDVASRFGELAKNRGIDVSISCEPETLSVVADIVLIERALSNLIQNALQHCSEEGKVSIRILKQDRAVILIVEDNGSGIPEAHLPYVFESFYRVERDRSRTSGGAGLGLAITQRIIRAHHGEISVESELGKGTQFCCRLPLDTSLESSSLKVRG